MTNLIYSDLLYKDSPFLPPILQEDVDELVIRIKDKKVSPLSSITQQAGHIGEALNLLHEKQISWIKTGFSCTNEDIILFYIGFTTPLLLILSAIQMNHTKTEVVIKNLTVETKLKKMTEHNHYKVQKLHDAYFIVVNKETINTQKVIEAIQGLCLNKPFSNNEFYLAGIESACHTMKELATKYQNTINPAT